MCGGWTEQKAMPGSVGEVMKKDERRKTQDEKMRERPASPVNCTGLERDNPPLPSRVAGPVELRTAAAFGAFGCLI